MWRRQKEGLGGLGPGDVLEVDVEGSRQSLGNRTRIQVLVQGRDLHRGKGEPGQGPGAGQCGGAVTGTGAE